MVCARCGSEVPDHARFCHSCGVDLDATATRTVEHGASGHPAPFQPDLIVVVRADGMILYLNQPLDRHSEEDIVCTRLTDWVIPVQRPAVRAALAQVFGKGRIGGLHLEGIRGRFAAARFACRVVPNVRDGKVCSATIVARDVTRHQLT